MTKKLLLVGFASIMAPGSIQQIVMATLVSLLFLVLHLQAYPYKNELDNVVATATHLMLCTFFIWCMLLQTGVLGSPEDSNSLSGSGSLISIVMVLSAIGVLVIAGMLFLTDVITRKAAEVYEAKQRAKWAGCTIEPPTTTWPAERGFACFLSHAKADAASDARFLHDMLAKMLRYPIFLDSSDLVDLRQLISNGVADSDVIIVLGTKTVFTRPWCLLECLHATRRNVPVVIIDVLNSPAKFDVDEAEAYIDNLEEKMDEADPDGLAFLNEQLSNDLSELKAAVLTILNDFKHGSRLSWNSAASDVDVIASLKDISEAMAKLRVSLSSGRIPKRYSRAADRVRAPVRSIRFFRAAVLAHPPRRAAAVGSGPLRRRSSRRR